MKMVNVLLEDRGKKLCREIRKSLSEKRPVFVICKPKRTMNTPEGDAELPDDGLPDETEDE